MAMLLTEQTFPLDDDIWRECDMIRITSREVTGRLLLLPQAGLRERASGLLPQECFERKFHFHQRQSSRKDEHLYIIPYGQKQGLKNGMEMAAHRSSMSLWLALVTYLHCE